jgi:phi13 family phage major tail protein
MADSNKVKFGLKNVYYSKITITGGVYGWGTPVAIKGAVNLSLDAQGEETNFYADDTKYYNVTNNTGYSGDLEVAKFPESFLADIFGVAADQDGVLFEDAEVEPAAFALLFEFAGDQNKTRHCLYNCTCSRPALNSGTLTESKEPVTESVTITASPLPIDSNGMRIVRSKCNEGDAEYSTWFSAVHEYTP